MMRKGFILIASLLFLSLCGSAPLQADDRKDLEKQLETKLKGTIIFFQTFYEDNKLEFDSKGALAKGSPATGPWELYALVEVNKIKVKKNKYIVRGKRVVLVYEGKERAQQHLIRSPVTATITLETDVDTPNEKDFFDKGGKVFFTGKSGPEKITPLSYRDFITGNLESKDSTNTNTPPTKTAKEPSPNSEKIYEVKGEVTKPKCIDCPAPNYPKLAKQARVGGTVVLWAIITPDGRVDKIRIAKRRGAGLDEAAVEAVQDWRFKPATRNGKPVPVKLFIEISFNYH